MRREMKGMLAGKWLIVDIEATCEQGGLPLVEMEIIEIGAVIVTAGKMVDEYQTFIRPERQPVLSTFCRDLTGIAQHEVDGAPWFPEAMKRFGEWVAPHDCAGWGSWGDYDRLHIEQECTVYPVTNPLSTLPHRNLKQEFAAAMKLDRAVGMSQALEIAGLKLEGSHHRALDDVRNIARLMSHIKKMGNSTNIPGGVK